jgi:hypothetical protein
MTDWKFGFETVIPEPLKGKRLSTKRPDSDAGRRECFFVSLMALYGDNFWSQLRRRGFTDGSIDNYQLMLWLKQEERERILFKVLPPVIQEIVGLQTN